MPHYKLEYIWLDGYEPVPNLRGKTKVVAFDDFPTLEQLPQWGFDGSSTKQAEGSNSDCTLHPVAVYPDAARTNGGIIRRNIELNDDQSGTVSSMELNPGKARVLLQLALMKTSDPGKIQDYFNRY